MNELCVREYSSCKCERCKAKSLYEKTELRLSTINVIRNRLGQQYSYHLGKIYDKVGAKAWRLKIDHNYDERSKALWVKMNDLDKRANRLIYKLNSLERTIDLYEGY